MPAALPEARIVPQPATPITSRLGVVIKYVTRADTLMVLGGLALVTTILRFLSTGPSLAPRSSFTVWVIVAGLEASMYFHIVETTASGQESLETPDFTSLGESLFAPLIRYIFTLVPMIAALVWYGKQAAGTWVYGLMVFVKPTDIFHYMGPAALLVAGVLLWPLMTMIAAIGRTITATYNPVIWIKTLRTFGGDYLIGVLLFYGVLVAETLVIPPIAEALTIPFVGVLIVQFLAYLPMALRARLLGEICRPYFEN
ncbi:MAG: hypothetical protein JWO36_3288 [Myxococcales bacterium]|nr:hypothetical protein [Myxococcales bacterium]